MNNAIREKIKDCLRELELSQTEFARRAEIPPDYFSKMMRGQTGGVPKHWASALDALGLELYVRPKTADEALKNISWDRQEP